MLLLIHGLIQILVHLASVNERGPWLHISASELLVIVGSDNIIMVEL